MPNAGRRNKVFILSLEDGYSCARSVEVGKTYVIPDGLKSPELAYRFLWHAGLDKVFFVNNVSNRWTKKKFVSIYELITLLNTKCYIKYDTK